MTEKEMIISTENYKGHPLYLSAKRLITKILKEQLNIILDSKDRKYILGICSIGGAIIGLTFSLNRNINKIYQYDSFRNKLNIYDNTI